MATEDWINDGYDNVYWDTEPYKGVVCQYCGKDGFHWGLGPGGWRLFDGWSNLHCCLPAHKPTKTQTPLPKRRSIMGLFNRKPIYVSDRGDTFDVEEMESSHLLNAINHHKKQIDTIDWILDQTGGASQKNQMLHLRRINLHTTVEALVEELITRDPDEDHDL